MSNEMQRVLHSNPWELVSIVQAGLGPTFIKCGYEPHTNGHQGSNAVPLISFSKPGVIGSQFLTFIPPEYVADHEAPFDHWLDLGIAFVVRGYPAFHTSASSLFYEPIVHPSGAITYTRAPERWKIRDLMKRKSLRLVQSEFENFVLKKLEDKSTKCRALISAGQKSGIVPKPLPSQIYRDQYRKWEAQILKAGVL
jgi:hypothetical protein